MPPPKKVVVNNVIDIKKILESFDPRPEAKTMLGKCLLDGFEMIKRHQEIDTATIVSMDQDPEVFGGFIPAKPPNSEDRRNWLDNMIRSQMGGRREGLKVVWDTVEGKYSFDPWTNVLDKVT